MSTKEYVRHKYSLRLTKDIKKWWIWGYRSSPLTTVEMQLPRNEFLGHSWSHILPRVKIKLWESRFESRGVFTSSNRVHSWSAITDTSGEGSRARKEWFSHLHLIPSHLKILNILRDMPIGLPEEWALNVSSAKRSLLQLEPLFLMKRGGEEIYVGPLGRNSCHLIKYFEAIELLDELVEEAKVQRLWM
ncbi:hypothetical protein IFM89_019041 [Coptis chinensis]|uniref:Uncharacterized protein n=1 Tax=Coptis chinensis TaxID=261450 RepID=A0A835HFL4_9MAGN|nr:hypothetical protein IFM89_019041 [Coptis chinensis]